MALIAVIDDDIDIREASELVLTSKGYKVITANNPKDGYDIIIKNKPDLIILDVMMDEPDDGFFLAQRLRRDKVKTPIIYRRGRDCRPQGLAGRAANLHEQFRYRRQGAPVLV